MRGYTLWQPWSSLIAVGLTLTVTRDWPVPDALIGRRIAIHSARRQPRFSEWNFETSLAAISLPMPLGAVVATAIVKQCVQVVCSGFSSVIENDPGPEKVWVLSKNAPEPYQPCQIDTDPYGDYSEGRWIWLLEDVRAIEPPVSACGFQGLWTLPDDVAQAVRAAEQSSVRRVT